MCLGHLGVIILICWLSSHLQNDSLESYQEFKWKMSSLEDIEAKGRLVSRSSLSLIQGGSSLPWDDLGESGRLSGLKKGGWIILYRILLTSLFGGCHLWNIWGRLCGR